MPFKLGKWPTGRIWLLLVMLLVIGLVSFGCVEGLQPIGWSGGVISDGTLFVGSKEGRLVAINTADESRQWSEALKAARQGGGFGCAPTYGAGCGGGASGVAIYGTPAVSGDLIYIGGYNGKIYAYTIDTLSIRWVYPRDDYIRDKKNKIVPIVGGMVVAEGRVYFGGSDGKVYALDAVTGDPVWDSPFSTGDKIWSTPAIYDGTLFIGSFDKKLYALNIADGREKWDKPFDTQGAIAATPLVYNGIVYIGSFDRHLYAVDANTGKLVWQFPATEDDENKPENWFWAKPVIYNDIIYAGCLDGKVHALRAGTGDKVAEFDLHSPASSAPVVFDGSIILASRDGTVYTIDTGLNALKQLASIDEDVYGPLCVSEEVIYIHTQDLTLHRINASNGAVLRPISLESPD